jgi:hypothetical protein
MAGLSVILQGGLFLPATPQWQLVLPLPEQAFHNGNMFEWSKMFSPHNLGNGQIWACTCHTVADNIDTLFYSP